MSSITSLAQVSAERVAILVRDIEAGVRLGSKDDLRRSVGVSQGTFNEALRLLQSRGIVSVRPGPGGGVFAAEPSPTVRLGNSMLAVDSDESVIPDAIRIREALDPLLMRDAAVYASAGDISQLRACLVEMRACVGPQDSTAFFHANLALHRKIACINPSSILRELYNGLIEVIEDHTFLVLPLESSPTIETFEERYSLHVDLVDAIETGNTARLKDVIERHQTTTYAREVRELEPKN